MIMRDEMLMTAKRNQGIFCSQKGRFNVIGGMRIRKKGRLELGGRKIDSPFKHGPEECGVAVGIRRASVW